jgi:hypothetical protein
LTIATSSKDGLDVGNSEHNSTASHEVEALVGERMEEIRECKHISRALNSFCFIFLTNNISLSCQ